MLQIANGYLINLYGDTPYNKIHSLYGREQGTKYLAFLHKLEEVSTLLEEAMQLREQFVEELKEINKRSKKE